MTLLRAPDAVEPVGAPPGWRSRVAPWLGIAVGVALVGVFVLRDRGELLRTVSALRGAALGWLLLAVLGGLGTQLSIALAYRATLRRLGHAVGLWPVEAALLQRSVVSMVMPIGGVPGIYAFTRALTKRGVNASDGFYVAVLNGMLSYVSFVVFLAPVLIAAVLTGKASGVMMFSALALVVVIVVVSLAVAALLRGGSSDTWIRRRTPGRVTAFIEQARGHGVRPAELLYPLALHLTVEFGGVLTLYAAVRSVRAEVSLLSAFIGYAAGVLFMLIAPVFQGSGPVEFSMTLALTRFGVPAGTALAAVLLYRAVELWLPFIIGVSVGAGSRGDARRAAQLVPAVLTAVTGVLLVMSVLAPSFGDELGRVRDYYFIEPTNLSRNLTLIAGFFLLFLSYGLWRRKRIAWLASLALLGAELIVRVVKRDDLPVALVAAANLVVLSLQWRRFRVRSDFPTVRDGLARFALSLLFAVAYGTLGFFVMDKRVFGTDFSARHALTTTLRYFFNITDAGPRPHTRYGAWFLDSLSMIGVVAAIYAIVAVLRPVVWRRRVLPQERARARDLIRRFGDSSLDFFKYYPDKLFFFSSTGAGVVSFRTTGGVAIALGDPVASNPDEFRRVLDEFLDFCDANGWLVAFHQVPGTRLETYRAAGLSALKVGEEAVVDLTIFTLAGGAMKSLRSSVHRLERDGYRAVYYPPPQSDARLRQLKAVSDAWLTINGRRERSFTLGQWDDAYVRACPVMTIEAADGTAVAFANLIPSGANGEATIDLMRRREEPRNAMDMLFVRLFEHCRAAGYTRFSEGMAPFVSVGARPGATATERAIYLFAARFHKVFSYQGLRAYKDKFHPIWEPRYIVYRSELTLPMVALALLRITEADGAAGAFAAEDFGRDEPNGAERRDLVNRHAASS